MNIPVKSTAVVKVGTVAKYVDQKQALVDKAALDQARIPSWVNGTAARGYTLIVRAGILEKAQAVLEKAKV